ncbi:alpha/beta fold hydrolase [Variovorax sp. OV329]|uniref:alpha/beta fold hydrolase n=1 Tax=Variovorax sp. OV329 TaxID=1882825 RepID=UPI0008E92A70|nr:alpha/beta hydrolase [Variovorax sp. OV329]SFM20223.1 Pimeloyl-ACP methyl ester carboxylesterase [Variovorax sp. OV329]
MNPLSPSASRASKALRILQSTGVSLALAVLSVLHAPVHAATAAAQKPTILLVHGAFAESLSWEAVIERLLADGYPVVAAANPLRGLTSDSAYVANLVDTIPGPVVMVGHSYGGAVISNAALGKPRVKGLVFVAAFAPDSGEALGELGEKFPGSTLGSALAPPVKLPDGHVDLYVQQAKYRDQIAADVPERVAALLASTQRPVAADAFSDKAGSPAWKQIPSRFIYGTADKAIAPPLLEFMARRAGSRHTVAVQGASHAVLASHAAEVAQLIEEAAAN